MRPTHALSLVSLVFLASCATNPLCIPPPPHALPSKPRGQKVTEEGVVAESRPAAVPSDFDAAAEDDSWRAGDSIALELEFEDGAVKESFWLLAEVTKPAVEDEPLSRATVRTTLLDHDGTVIGTALRRMDPTRLPEKSREIHAAYSALVTAAASGDSPEHLQELIEANMAEDSAFDETRVSWFREMRRLLAPRFIRRRLEAPALNSSIGGVSILDLALAALVPPEVIVDVQRLNQEQSLVADFDDIPVARPVRLPFVVTLGGAIHLRFAVTLTTPAPPYVLTGGVLELAGVNEARGDRRFLIRIVSAKRGPAPETRPAESKPSDDPDRDEGEDR